jgi:dihydropyrimidinase/allantoinase
MEDAHVSKFDSVVVGGNVVLPGDGPQRCDIGIKEGKIAAIADQISSTDGAEVVDAKALLVVPGSVDCHSHLGIYRPLDSDARSETASSLVGGVTTLLSYFRTGQHYMNKTGPYKAIYPEVLALTEGNSYVDYGYHIAPMDSAQVGEIEWLVKAGVTTLKYFMFYKGLNLSASSTDGKALTMSDAYDLGHLYSIMEETQRVSQQYGSGGRIAVSVHCEDDELIRKFIDKVKQAGLGGLEAYCKARPPLSERVAIHKAAAVAAATKASLNLLHLSSAEALTAALEAKRLYPDADIRIEATLHHLGLTYQQLEGKGLGGKVNPPLRTPDDIAALWDGVLKGQVDWVGSDHACTMSALKGDELWAAACGFGGTSLMYPFMISEGYHKRGLSLSRVVELVSTNPARGHACYPRKGQIAIGADADLALIDLELTKKVTAEDLHSAQDHTPFEGVELKGWPVRTLLRGQTAFLDGNIVGKPKGVYIKRPV